MSYSPPTPPTPIDEEIAIYEQLIVTFEGLQTPTEKGQALYQCDVEYQKLIGCFCHIFISYGDKGHPHIPTKTDCSPEVTV
jgi:hypothetical protein